jgi:hypothetical protein
LHYRGECAVDVEEDRRALRFFAEAIQRVHGARIGVSFARVADLEEIWIPLVDEPIGSIVERLQHEQPGIDSEISTPHRVLAFRTFAYIRVGIVLGQLLFEHDLPTYDGSTEWVDRLLANAAYRERLADEIRAVANEIAHDPKYADDERLGPDDDARERFRRFARQQLEER